MPGSRVRGNVELRGLRCAATQGDPPAETVLLVDVRIQIELERVAETDAFADVVDLADLARTVRLAVAARPRRLLETIAVHTLRQILATYASVLEVSLRVAKPEPAGLEAAEEAVEVRLGRQSTDHA
jgi:dihydroneopterin aldolase